MGAVMSGPARFEALRRFGEPPGDAKPSVGPATTESATEPEIGRRDADSIGERQRKGTLMAVDQLETDKWPRVKRRLKTELGDDVYTSWFARVELEEAAKGNVTLSVPTRFLKSWIQAHYFDRLLALWKEEQSDVVRIDIIVRGTVRARQQPRTEKPAEPAQATSRPQASAPTAATSTASAARRAESDGPLGGAPVDPRLTFESFCEGVANRVAFAAARAVAETPPGRPAPFNPLYIHAGVGRGKTHLLHATARAARLADPGRKVVYLTAEHFMFRFVAALRNQSAIPFKEGLREIDLLLIDDMQFLQGKTVQQEFCHMLNALIDGARQVVVAADRPPAELETLDERVRSRLRGGVAFEIGAPDLDLRRQDSRRPATRWRRSAIPVSIFPRRSSNMSPSRWSPTAATWKARSTGSSPSGSSPTIR